MDVYLSVWNVKYEVFRVSKYLLIMLSMSSKAIMNEWMDGWMNEWMIDWMNGWMNECMNDWMNEWMNGWMDEWMNRCVKWINK